MDSTSTVEAGTLPRMHRSRQRAMRGLQKDRRLQLLERSVNEAPVHWRLVCR